VATQVSLLTFDQFLDLPEQEGVRRELDERVLVEMGHPSFAHGAAITRLSYLLLVHRQQSGRGFAVSTNTPFRLAPDIVRAPDLCLVETARLQAMPIERGVLVGAPDLAVEVVSPSESAIDLNRKMEQYLQAGATAAWALYTDSRLIMVYRRKGETWRLTSSQTLHEPDLLPGLSLSVEEIFAV